MSADLLREAAAKMRERAEAATPGPWEHYGDCIVWPSEKGPAANDPVLAMVGPAHDGCGAHIASWHPAVALAVADWLWETANLIEVHAGTECAEPCLHPTCRVIDRALAVARAYLGEAS